ncbi:MAG: hypothetical protein ACI3YS_01840 [Prevotella sp.]
MNQTQIGMVTNLGLIHIMDRGRDGCRCHTDGLSLPLVSTVNIPSRTICHAVCTGNALARICTLISCGIGAMHCFGLLTSLAYAGAV